MTLLVKAHNIYYPIWKMCYMLVPLGFASSIRQLTVHQPSWFVRHKSYMFKFTLACTFYIFSILQSRNSFQSTYRPASLPVIPLCQQLPDSRSAGSWQCCPAAGKGFLFNKKNKDKLLKWKKDKSLHALAERISTINPGRIALENYCSLNLIDFKHDECSLKF